MNRITTNITLHKCLFCCFRCATLIITLSHKLSFCLLFAGLGLSMLVHCCCLQNHFVARYSTTLLAKLYMTCFLFDVKFWQMDHVFAKFASAIFCLICCYVCAETTAVVLLALTLYTRCSAIAERPRCSVRYSFHEK